MKALSNIVDEYEITPYTLMMQPIIYEGELCTHVWEVHDDFIVLAKPLNIIKTSCEYFGSSYEGRKEGTRHLTGYTHKAPIVIDQTSSIFFFPTASPQKQQCIWISYHHVELFRKDMNNDTSLVFSNKLQKTIPVSYSTFETQVERTARLKTKLDHRIAETRRKYQYWKEHPGHHDFGH